MEKEKLYRKCPMCGDYFQSEQEIMCPACRKYADAFRREFEHKDKDEK